MQLQLERIILTYSHAGRHQICRESALKAIVENIFEKIGNLDQNPQANTT